MTKLQPGNRKGTPQRRHIAAIDPAEDPLRVALGKMRSFIGAPARILTVAKRSGYDVPISPAWLKQFMEYDGEGEGRSINRESREVLEAFVFHSRLGRALLNPQKAETSGYDLLVQSLAGNDIENSPIEAEGLYFLYHGSYLLDGHFAIRAVQISREDDTILAVDDSINDNLSGKGIIEAHGCLVFFGTPARPHIVTDGSDNRHGLNLFIGTSMISQIGKIRQVVGTMIGMTDRAQHFYRHAIIVRAPAEATFESVLSQTGIYTLAALKDTSRFDPAHARAIEELARQIPLNTQCFPDPILALR